MLTGFNFNWTYPLPTVYACVSATIETTFFDNWIMSTAVQNKLEMFTFYCAFEALTWKSTQSPMRTTHFAFMFAHKFHRLLHVIQPILCRSIQNVAHHELKLRCPELSHPKNRKISSRAWDRWHSFWLIRQTRKVWLVCTCSFYGRYFH